MTVFKTFWKVVKKYKGTIILYTVMLIIFGGLNMTANNSQTDFINTKPDIIIKNEDKKGKLSKNLVSYMKKNSNLIKLEEKKASILDALFYREVNYVIEIPENYSESIIKKKPKKIRIKSTKDYQASLAEMMLKRYLKIENIYSLKTDSEEELIESINRNLKKTSQIEISSKLDTDKTTNASKYFSFASYSIMAVIIFVICLVMSSFKDTSIKKRTIISSRSYRKYNMELLISSLFYSLAVWVLFIILGVIILGDIMFTIRGLIYMINSLVFTFCCLTIALVISTLVKNKNAVSGIVNVVALGSAFLCGAFVPAEWLPEKVLKIAHILPSYWYINSNDLLKKIERINIKTLQPIFFNTLVILGFSLGFIIINNIVSKYKQKET